MRLTMTICFALLAAPAAAQDLTTPEALGEALFFDTNLSANRTQACATCHSPDFGFSDPRMADPGGAASLGDDGVSLGGRNAPSASYASFTPPFHVRADGVAIGGQFWDGRAKTLADQAGGPPLNPVEMGMPSKAAVAERLAENPDYMAAFQILMGVDGSDPHALYAAMTDAIAAFELTKEFAPFDSKYDRYLRGEAKLTDQEELGRVLFFSQQFTNCNLCHQLSSSAMDPRETFTNYEFHNIGVPVNADLNAAIGRTTPDHGLLENPQIDDPAQDGKFKVPTLRNVAVTGPYMHNGVFADLRTVVLFYNKYNSLAPRRQINPETGESWRAPEVPGALSVDFLTEGPALDDKRVDALVAFLKTLTDQRYEYLLED